jgi:hypothetical protein
MAPKPLRKQTHKSAASLPTTQTAKFLLNAAITINDNCPQVAAVLGRKSLQVRIHHSTHILHLCDDIKFSKIVYI